MPFIAPAFATDAGNVNKRFANCTNLTTYWPTDLRYNNNFVCCDRW